MSAQLEAAETIGDWQQLSPLTIAAQLVRSLGSMALPIGAAAYSVTRDGELADIGPWIILPAACAILAIITGLTWLRWRRQRYRVGANDVQFEQGLISRTARSVPFERIQDVSLEQKLIPRLLGLVEVRFETGAGGKDELKLAYVAAAQGELLRETVRAQGDVASVSSAVEPLSAKPASDAPVDTASETIFAMSNKRLVKFGLFEFSLVVFAVLFGFVQQFDVLLPFDFWDVDEWDNRLTGPGQQLAGLGLWVQLIGIIAMLAGVVALGLVTGVVRTVLREYGFRLDLTAKGFRRRRGLLTLTDVVMPAHRVQAVTVSTGLLRRIWGWHGLSFISLAQDAKSANHDVAPFAQMAEIAPIAQAAHFALPNTETRWHRPSPRYHGDRAAVLTLVPAIAAVAAIIWGEVLAGLAVAALGIILPLREYWLWRVHRHALDARQVLSRKGWLVPKLLIASRVKLHSAQIAQGPIASRRGYADLRFGLAGGRLTFRGLPVDEARKLRAAVLDSIAEIDFAKLPR